MRFNSYSIVSIIKKSIRGVSITPNNGHADLEVCVSVADGQLTVSVYDDSAGMGDAVASHSYKMEKLT